VPSSLIPDPGATLEEVLQWADAECRLVAAAIADDLRPRLWAVRLALAGQVRLAAAPAERSAVQGRIAALEEATSDLRSVEAVLDAVEAPISWDAFTDTAG
jgi:hypothetical protein